MDPNKTYLRIKELIKKDSLSPEEREDLADFTESLENWIDNGGFLPENFNIEVLNNASMRAYN